MGERQVVPFALGRRNGPPVVEDAATGAATWPKTGNGDVRVVSFSWWVIKDYANARLAGW
jgi:hypothetical protein